MKTVVADKIGSVAQDKGLKRELRVSADIPCEEGILVAVEILNNKATYNKLELTSGRMAQVKRGDVIVGALGHRKALFGYSGHLPESLAPGDEIQVLNIGGVLGICDSINTNFGQPFNARVLGAVLEFPILGERIGVPARAGATQLQPNPPVETAWNTGGRPRRHLHGFRQDGGGERDRQPAAASRLHRRRLQGHRRFVAAGHPRHGGRRARAIPRYSPTSAWSRPRRRTARR